MENEKKNIMSYQSVLPEDFDGTFRFTNWSDEDFTAQWAKKEYLFPKESTSVLIIPEESPLSIQQIRKRFALKLAIREYYKGKEYELLKKRERNADGTPRLYGLTGALSYSIDQLTPLIQRCLEPLPIAPLHSRGVKQKSIKNILSRNDEGKIVTTAVGQNDDLEDAARSGKNIISEEE